MEFSTADELGGFIADVERFALDLREVLRQFASDEPPAVDESCRADPEPEHPASITMTCPPWCKHRGSRLVDEWPVDRPHFGLEVQIPLTLGAPFDGDGTEVYLPEIVTYLGQLPFADEPRIGLTIEGRNYGFCDLTLGEARALQVALSKLIDEGAQHAQPGSLPALDELLVAMNITIVEDPNLDVTSSGYAVAQLAEHGHGWVCLPRGMSRARREESVRSHLSKLTSGPNRPFCESDPPITITGDQPLVLPRAKGSAPRRVS